ncbi:MAG: hypothetical protein ACR2FJ_08805, partial [Qipengyuania sp.]
MFLLPFAGLAGVLFGLPLALILRKFRKDTLPNIIGTGMLVGGSLSFAILAPLSVKFDSVYYVLSALVGLIPGVVAA